MATVKKHNIIIERWPGEIGPHGKRMPPCFRWTVTYEKDGVFQVQGYEDTHAAARAAAEACLVERGIDMDWLPKRPQLDEDEIRRRSGKPRRS